ncbi:MAG: prepilin-type N-terminal cleavage/methylation domain-containing protein [Candidatus Paceibacterota bacterium]|jgi:prepilin-type N-terminal cleavage/methylation domain-containing protein
MNTSFKKGFTLIETLVAVTILMVAIAGPLTVAMKAYTASLDARNQTIATNLAQETMEYLNNIKDNSNESQKGNKDGFNYPSQQCDSSSHPCDVNVYHDNSGKLDRYVDCSSSISNCRLYNSDSYGYNHNTGISNTADNKLTPFTRYFYLTDLTDPQALATVVVSWNTGSTANSVTLQEVLSNTTR